jgi:negative regulator of flagellin synthesis FlgM
MVDSIKNMSSRINVHVKKENLVAKNAVNLNGNSTPKADRVEVGTNAGSMAALELAKSPHVDSAAVSRIKHAISNGDYPVDVDKVTDALMDAYLELKS